MRTTILTLLVSIVVAPGCGSSVIGNRTSACAPTDSSCDQPSSSPSATIDPSSSTTGNNVIRPGSDQVLIPTVANLAGVKVEVPKGAFSKLQVVSMLMKQETAGDLRSYSFKLSSDEEPKIPVKVTLPTKMLEGFEAAELSQLAVVIRPLNGSAAIVKVYPDFEVTAENSIKVSVTSWGTISVQPTSKESLYASVSSVLSNLPPVTTNATTATINVGGSGILTYRYALKEGASAVSCDNAVYPSAWLSVGSPISLSGLAQGAKRLCVVGRDKDELQQQDPTAFAWTVDLTPPVVNAGPDLTTSVAITTAASTSESGAYLWTKLSGPGAVTFGSSTSLATTISADFDGVYVIRLTVTDSVGNSSSDDLSLTWNSGALGVNAGSDLIANASTTLTANVVNAASVQWSKLSGPGAVTFGSPHGNATTVSMDTDGTYVIRLTATGADASTASDDVSISWDTSPPTVNAGVDVSAIGQFSQVGTATGAVSYLWTKVSGSGTVTFGSPNALTTTVTASANNTYVLRLTATDLAGNAASDDFSLVWDITPPTSNPVFVSATPASPSSSSTTPAIIGTSSADTNSVSLYSNSSCSAAIGNGTKSQYESTGIAATVGVNATTAIYAKALDALGNATSCVLLTSYKHDSVAPTISLVTSTKADSTLGVGDIIDVRVTFSEAVTVSGTPLLTMETGTTDRSAFYDSMGSTNTVLRFDYTVQAGDSSSDLDYASTTALALNGGAIADAAGNAAILTLATPGASGSLGFGKNLIISTTLPAAPTVSGTTPVNSTTPTWTWTSNNAGGTGNFRYKLDNSTLTSGATASAATSFTPGSALSAGSHTLYVQEADSNSQWSTSGSFAITIDVTAPTAPTVTSSAATTNNTTPTWTWTQGGGGNASFRYKLDNSTLTAGATATSSASFTPGSALSAGAHTLYVQETDDAGNWSSSGSFAVTIDDTAPTAPAVTGTTPTNSTTPTWSWTAGGGGNGSYRYRLDNSTLTTGATTTSATSFTPGSALSAGSHTVYVQEQDDAGNWSNSGSFAIVIDLTPPTAPSVTGTTPSSSATPTWSWTASGGGNGSFRYKLDDSTLTSGATATSAITFIPGSALSAGSHTVYVQEQDDAGNWSSSGSFAIVIDLTPPTAPSVTSTTPTNNTTPAWTWTAGGGGNGNYRYKLDNSTLTSGATATSTPSYTPGSALSAGTHTLYVQETDDAGNWSSSGSFAVLIDLTAPSAPSVTSTTPTNNTTPTWTWTAGGGGNGSFKYKLDDSDLSSGTSTTTSATFTAGSVLAAGSHTLYVQERDDAGNWSASGSFAVTIDLTAPSAPSVTGAASPSSDPKPTWTWTAGGGGNGTFRYKLDDATLTSGATTTTSLSYTPGSNLSSATHTLYVQERDDAGNWSSSGNFDITVAVSDTTPPTSTITTSGTIGPNTTAGANTTISGTASDASGIAGVSSRVVKHSLYSELGTWSTAANAGFLGGGRTAAASSNEARAVWTLAAPIAGNYIVYATWKESNDLATNASYSVYDGATLSASVSVDQHVAPADQTYLSVGWKSLGTYNVANGKITVVLTNSGANGPVYADAIRLASVTSDGVATVIDNADAGFAMTSGTWTSATTTSNGSYNDNYRYIAASTGGTAKATWTFTGLATGYYEVSTTWLGDTTNHSKGGPYTIYDNTTSKWTAQVDFRSAPEGVTVNNRPFYVLGTVYITSGTLVVEVNNNFTPSGASNRIIADAARIVGVSSNGGTTTASIDGGTGTATGYAESGTWATNTVAGQGYNGNSRNATSSGGVKTASWTFTGLSDSAYAVYATWTVSFANRVSDAPYDVYDNTTLLGTTTINQRISPSGLTLAGAASSTFQLLGYYHISSGTLKVVLSTSNTSLYTIADTVLVQEQTFMVDNSSAADKCVNSGLTAFDATCPQWNAATGTTSWSSSILDSLFSTGFYTIESRATDAAGGANVQTAPTYSLIWWDPAS